MIRKRRKIPFVALLVSSFLSSCGEDSIQSSRVFSSGSFSGHPCSDILVHGIMERTSQDVRSTKYRLAKTYFCQASSSDVSSSSNLSLKAAFQDITGNLGYSNEKHKRWQQSSCTYEERSYKAEDFQFHAVSELVNEAGVNAWKECMKGRNQGLIAFRSRLSGNVHKVHVEWNGRGDANMSYQLTNISYRESPDTKIYTNDKDEFSVTHINPRSVGTIKIKAQNLHAAPSVLVTFTDLPETKIVEEENKFECSNGVCSVPNHWGGSGFTASGDFDGDGRSDIASARFGKVYVKLNREDGFNEKVWSVPDRWGGEGFFWAGDFNGDGKDDLASASNGNIYVNLSTGTGFSHKVWSVPNNWGGADYSWVGDFDGDGRDDIATARDGNVYVNLSKGDSFSQKLWKVPNRWGGSGFSWTGDFNGDGRTDIASANHSNIYINLSTGNGFDQEVWTVPNRWGGAGYTWAGDFNGDGKSDIATAVHGDIIINFSSGSSFNQTTWSVPNRWGGSGFSWALDLNGDGISDLAAAHHGEIYVNLSNGKNAFTR